MIIKILITALAIFVVAYILPGVAIASFWTAIVVAVVLGLINVSIKPLLVLLTLPVTIFTLGLFLLVINAVMVLLVAKLVPGFAVDGFWWALLFSVLVSVLGAFLGTRRT